MYTSHLKVIARECFLKVGLFQSRYDSHKIMICSKVSEKFQFGYINEYLYQHRIHENQVSQKELEKQENLSQMIRLKAIKRRNILNREFDGLVSIVMLTFNRLEDTIRSIESIYKYTTLPFELIIFDNASSDPKMKDYLINLKNTRHNVRIIFNEVNLGCSGGRKKRSNTLLVIILSHLITILLLRHIG